MEFSLWGAKCVRNNLLLSSAYRLLITYFLSMNCLLSHRREFIAPLACHQLSVTCFFQNVSHWQKCWMVVLAKTFDFVAGEWNIEWTGLNHDAMTVLRSTAPWASLPFHFFKSNRFNHFEAQNTKTFFKTLLSVPTCWRLNILYTQFCFERFRLLHFPTGNWSVDFRVFHSLPLL